MPMMKIGSQRLPDSSRTGPTAKPLVSRTVERLIAKRYTGNAHTTSSSRERTPSVTPPKKPATRPITVPSVQVRSAAVKPIRSEFRAP